MAVEKPPRDHEGPPDYPCFRRWKVPIMLESLNDMDDDVILKKANIDRGVGYLIAGIVVILFFAAIVLSIGQVQQRSDQTGTLNRYTPEQKDAEIGNSEGAGVKD